MNHQASPIPSVFYERIHTAIDNITARPTVAVEAKPRPTDAILAAFAVEDGYLWSWHCNIAMSYIDATGQDTPRVRYLANLAAGMFLDRLCVAERFKPTLSPMYKQWRADFAKASPEVLEEIWKEKLEKLLPYMPESATASLRDWYYGV